MSVRRRGIPRTNIERVMTHYDISYEEAERMIAERGVEDLLPPRGAGLQNVNWVLVATGGGAVITGVAMIWVGLQGS